MITENELHEYNKWLMTVWNPNQLYIPFAVDAPKAYLDHRNKVKNISSNTVLADVNPLKDFLLGLRFAEHPEIRKEAQRLLGIYFC